MFSRSRGGFALCSLTVADSGGSGWAEWTATYRSRFGVEPPVSAECSSRPFLAEWHLRPTDLASASQRLLSPGPGSAPPTTA